MTRRTLIFGGVALALRRERLNEATHLIQSHVDSGEVRAAVLHVRSSDQTLSRAFGAARTPKAVFLLAPSRSR